MFIKFIWLRYDLFMDAHEMFDETYDLKLRNKFLTEFNLFMQVNFAKKLETSFWDFVHKF